MTDASFNLDTLHAPADVRAAIDRLFSVLRSQLDTMSAEEVDQRIAAFLLLDKKQSELTPAERYRVASYLDFVYGEVTCIGDVRPHSQQPHPVDNRLRRLEIAIAIERDLFADCHSQLVDSLTEVAVHRELIRHTQHNCSSKLRGDVYRDLTASRGAATNKASTP